MNDIQPLKDGIIPTMLVAYKQDGSIDYNAMEILIEWYIANGADGLFALCHSTESHWLTLAEKEELIKFVMKAVHGRIPVTASGVTSDSTEQQIREACMVMDSGADAVVFLRNRLGADINHFQTNLEQLMDAVPDVPLGLYECPYSFKQTLSDDEFRFLLDTGRFCFLKDTVCNVTVMQRRAQMCRERNTSFQLYNANCATFLESLRFGYSGFCGIMANFHPDLYAWLFSHPNDSRSEIISSYLGVMSLIEMRSYPICAKRYLRTYEGIPITDVCRSAANTTVQALEWELKGIWDLTEAVRSMIGVGTDR
jgi:4-hydroxy-tetrahydrodipicolinate synthase